MTDRTEEFVSAFGSPPGAAASAPGRVNLIGEHTDYHQGFVLPMPLPQSTTVRLRLRRDQVVRVMSAAMPTDGIRQYNLGEELPGAGWLDYVQGVTFALRKRGLDLAGFDAAIDSSVPSGGGVSSSAALTVALLRALRAAMPLELNDVELARLAQLAETDFVGAPIGIMDQMACSLGRPGEALLIDTRSLHYDRIVLPRDAGVIVIDSGVTHNHAGGQYAERRRESFAAAAALGVQWLRDATVVPPTFDGLSDVMQRRARHVVTENRRVLEAADALRADDLARLGALFNESHDSQRDDYETSTREIDTLVAIAQSDQAIYGARLTGGGFGGSVVMVTTAAAASAAAERVLRMYQDEVGREGRILLPRQAPTPKELMSCG